MRRNAPPAHFGFMASGVEDVTAARGAPIWFHAS
jgi:hypothetical protein